jgi:hypothetical protein
MHAVNRERRQAIGVVDPLNFLAANEKQSIVSSYPNLPRPILNDCTDKIVGEPIAVGEGMKYPVPVPKKPAAFHSDPEIVVP